MRPNVLLVVLDSVRAANVSAYGHGNRTTPFLESFADRATLYEQARASGSWSLPSHVSLFTGLQVPEHGIVEPGQRLETGHTVFEWLRDRGYETGLFSENPWLTAMDAGLDAGFDVVEGGRNLLFPAAADPVEFTATEGHGNYLGYIRRCLDDEYPVRSALNGVANKLAWDHPGLVPDRLTASAPAGRYVNLFEEWRRKREGPWAACLNFMDAHAPYQPSSDHDRWGGSRLRRLQRRLDKHVWSFHGGDEPWWLCRALEALYDGTIRQVDAALGRLVAGLRADGELSETFVVVTSDHGEGFGERSQLKHGARVVGHVEGIHESLLHVPLVTQLPGQRDGDVVADPVTLASFPAAVREVVAGDGIDSGPAPLVCPDRPVVAASTGLTEPNMRLAETYCDPDDLWQFSGRMRAIYDPADRGVVKFADWEDNSATLDCIDPVTSYVREWSAGGRTDAVFDGFEDAGVGESVGLDEVDDAVRGRLRELGYVR